MFMGGISGSSLADTTSVGAIMIPAMKSQNYPANFACALTSAANMVGPIIPPSILMILYGFATQQSIFALFFGGVIPGVIISIVYGIMAYVISIRKNYGPPKERFNLQLVLRSFVEALPAIGIPVVIVIGVLGGVFTVTESAAVAAAYALVFTIIKRFISDTVTWRTIWLAFRKTYNDTAVVSFLIGGSALLGLALTMNGFANEVVSFVAGLHLPNWDLLAVMNLIMIILGTFLEPAASILIIVSVFVPLVQSQGIDLVQFGVLTVVNLQIGTLTPPVGTYYIKNGGY
jgi:tripartite ATP-independent transporter DctM subunit